MQVLVLSTLFAAALCAAPAPPPGWTASGRLLLVPARLESNPPPAEYPRTTAQPETNTTGVTQESESDESQSAKLLESGEYYVLLPDGRLQMVKYATAALKAEEEETADSEQNDQSSQDQRNQEQSRYNAQGPYKFEQPSAYYVQAQQQQFAYKPQQSGAYYTQAQQEKNAQYNQEQQYNAYKPQQSGAYYIQAQQEKNAQYVQEAQSSQKFQPAAYPVFIRPAQEQESAQYKTEKSQQVNQEPSNLQIDLVQFPLEGSKFSQTKLQLSKPESAQTKEEETKEEETGFEANLQFREVKPIPAPIYAYNPAPLVRILKK